VRLPAGHFQQQVLISRGPRARGAVLQGLIPAYQRKVSDLLDTVKIGSVDALDEAPQASAAPAETKGLPSSPSAAVGARATPSAQTEPLPDSMAAVGQRVASMPPIILGKDMADDLGQ